MAASCFGYAAIRQACFYAWKLNGKEELPYETVRNAIVYVARMTGHDEEDIAEYLENSF